MKLHTMTDFVLNYTPKDATPIGKIVEYKDGVINYAKFLKTTLTLGMFVPCDEEGNVLEEPEICFAGGGVETSEYIKYKQAKEKVLFDFGYEMNVVVAESIINGRETIEGMSELFEPTLTDNAIKQLGL